MTLQLRSLIFPVGVALVFAGGCSAHSQLLPGPASVAAPAIAIDKVPPDCKKQQTTDQYATVTEKLSAKGGKMCIPAFGGLGGTVEYPPASPATTVTLTGSTTNYNGKLPSLGSGTPVYYLQVALGAGTSFGQDAKAGGGLTGKAIKAGKPYTVYGQAVILGFPVNFTPCYTIATKGPYGGIVGGIGTLLKGESVPSHVSGVIEVYPGQNASAKC